MVETITAVVLKEGTKSIFVDKNLIAGPNPNQRGKLLIPFIVVLQVCIRNLNDSLIFLFSYDLGTDPICLLLMLACFLQYLFAVRPIERAIRSDILNESRPSWETHEY